MKKLKKKNLQKTLKRVVNLRLKLRKSTSRIKLSIE
jgi:hypothetical protein